MLASIYWVFQGYRFISCTRQSGFVVYLFGNNFGTDCILFILLIVPCHVQNYLWKYYGTPCGLLNRNIHEHEQELISGPTPAQRPIFFIKSLSSKKIVQIIIKKNL